MTKRWQASVSTYDLAAVDLLVSWINSGQITNPGYSGSIAMISLGKQKSGQMNTE